MDQPQKGFPIKPLLLVAVFILGCSVASSQPLIMMLFGDKIASPTFVGGINGGVGYTTLSEYPDASYRLNWMFGTYLNWQISEHWHFAPGVTFKTPAGAAGMQGLWKGDPAIDTILSEKKE